MSHVALSRPELKQMLERTERDVERLLRAVRGARAFVDEGTTEPVRAYLLSEDLRAARGCVATALRDAQEQLDILTDSLDSHAGPCPRDTGVIARTERRRGATG